MRRAVADRKCHDVGAVRTAPAVDLVRGALVEGEVVERPVHVLVEAVVDVAHRGRDELRVHPGVGVAHHRGALRESVQHQGLDLRLAAGLAEREVVVDEQDLDQ